MKRQQKSTAARGYGGHHQALRRQWKPIVDRGEVVCGRCRRLIAAGEPWDLSHPSDEKLSAPEPWHAACNRSYATTVTKPRRQTPPQGPQQPTRPPGWRSPDGRPWSRDWGGGHWGD
jgi:hypothetical protein